MEKYKLQYWDTLTTVLSIKWANDRQDYVSGDCRVRAVTGDTNVDEHNRKHFQRQKYSASMTLEEARQYVAQNLSMLGEVHDCVGLTLEDVCRVVEFPESIQIRNITER